MTPVHDFGEDVPQVCPGNLVAQSKVVDQDVLADREVPCGEGVAAVPALAPKAVPPHNKSMEGAQRIHHSAHLWGVLGQLEIVGAQLGCSSLHVGLQGCGRLVDDLARGRKLITNCQLCITLSGVGQAYDGQAYDGNRREQVREGATE